MASPPKPSGPIAVKRPSGRRFLGLHLVLLAAAAAVVVAGSRGLLPVPPVVYLPAAAALPLIGFAVAFLIARATTYRLFPTTLEVQRGLLSRHIENLQLFRVRDLSLHQGVLGRLLDVGDLVLVSTDENSPRLVVRGVAGPLAFYELLRRMVAEHAEKRTMIVERDHPPHPSQG